MKLGKTSWLILTLGIFIIAFGSLGVARSQQVEEQSQLEDELTVAEKRLSNLQLKEFHSQKNELEQQLDQALSQLEDAKDVLHQSIESIVVTDALFEIASACDVVIIQVNSSAISQEKLPGMTSSVTRLNITVEGDVLSLISFITKLNNDFTTGVVESAGISTQRLVQEEIQGEAGEEETEGETGESTEGETGEATTPNANIQLLVYTYGGD